MADKEINAYVMSLKEIEEKQIMACDVLCILPYPIDDNKAPYVDPEYDSKQRIIYFRPGRETKYFKNITKKEE
jgi:hypothetical protein